MDIIVATVSENCLVMVMLVFDVPYQRGALDVKKKKKKSATVRLSWGGCIRHWTFSSSNLCSYSCPFCLWMWEVQLDFYDAVCFLVCISVYACMCACLYVVGSCQICLWECGVYEFVRERAPAFIKSVAPALTFTPPPKCFVVFICLPSDTDSIPPPSASTAPLPKCLAEGETVSQLCSHWSTEQLKIHNIS